MTVSDGTRPLEAGVHTGAAVDLSYGAYLHLDEVLGAQHPLQPARAPRRAAVHRPAPDLRALAQAGPARAGAACASASPHDDLRPALKGLARVKHVQRTLTEQWSVLATLTPPEYAEFRSALGRSSGFQSWQYRAVEFVLGNKNAAMLDVFAGDADGARPC